MRGDRLKASPLDHGLVGARRRTVGFFLRHSANLHYFASIRPYLDYFLQSDGAEVHVIAPFLMPGYHEIPDFASYAHLFTANLRIDDCDLVLTPTFLRPEDRPGPRNGNTRIVQVFHGMSDKPFTYERDFSGYALCLCAGQRQVDRLLRHTPNRHARWAIIGYPKFESIRAMPPLFDNDRRTLIYCPTWRKGGISSIELFLDDRDAIQQLTDRYNLAVKPHPNIFSPSRPYFDQSIVDRLESIPDIRLIRSGNVMPWFAQADLFIGDISAAGYEWLYFNRPSVFLNPRPFELRPSTNVHDLTYLWQSGTVCDSVWDLGGAIDSAFADDRHATAREAILNYSVCRPRDRGAIGRGIAAIEALLGAEADGPEVCDA